MPALAFARWSLAALAVPAIAASISFGCVGRAFQADPTAVPPLAPTSASTRDAEGVPLAVDCLDLNGDRRIDHNDLTPAVLPDLNLDGKVDDRDVTLLGDIDIPLDQRCSGDRQFILNPPSAGPPKCPDQRFAVIASITGAAPKGLTNDDDGKGVRDLVDELQAKLKGSGFDSASLLSVPNLPSASNQNAAMEVWLGHVLRGILDAYPCVRLVIVGHSHGASAALAVAAWLERQGYSNELAYLVLIDRVTLRYTGDTESLPANTPILHVYQQNGGEPACVTSLDGEDVPTQNGAPLGARTNVHEIDVSDRGLCHGNIDDDPLVQQTIVDATNAVMNAPRP